MCLSAEAKRQEKTHRLKMIFFFDSTDDLHGKVVKHHQQGNQTAKKNEGSRCFGNVLKQFHKVIV